jgi:threonine dehydratase
MRKAVDRARERIAPDIRLTPCRPSPALTGATGTEVYLKLENLQASGSFKIRGVANKIRSLDESKSHRQLIAASTGNHAAAFAHVVQKLGLRGKLFLPQTAAPVKIRAIEDYGVPYEMVGQDCVQTELHAADYAREHGCVVIKPYNDPEIVAGQGTIAAELLDQLDGFDTVLVPIGGGGLISGIAAFLKEIAPEITVIGCQPVNSCVMYESLQAGTIVDIESLPTLSDATAGGIEPGSITFDLCRDFVDDFIMVSEEEIMAAIRLVYAAEKMAIEGGAALTVAALLKERARFEEKRAVLIISGGKIDDAVLKEIGCDHD